MGSRGFWRHVGVVMLQWGHDRMPLDFELVRRKDHPHDRSEHRLIRGRLVRFRRPAWAETVVVVADAAFTSTASGRLIQPRASMFVMAIAWT